MNKVHKIKINAKYFGKFDVIVCGGGTAGCVAALASAREGAKTLLLEKGPFLGGMMSVGNAGLTKFVLHGKDENEQTKISHELTNHPENVQIVGGIPLEITQLLLKNKEAIGTSGFAASYVYTNSHAFKKLLFELLLNAGVIVSLHSQVFQVVKHKNRVKEVIFITKEGPCAAGAEYFIDTTGDGDVAALAGADFAVGSCEDDAVVKQGLTPKGELQVAGSMYRIGGVDFDAYVNFLKENPDAFAVQEFGLMSFEEFLKSYEKGDMVIARGIFKDGERFQVYNYPHKGIMIGCTGISVKNLNGLDNSQLTVAEYEVLKAADRQVEKLKNEMPGFSKAYVLDVPAAGIRETRHIVGEYKLNINDILTGKIFDDSIGFSSHPVDIQPYPKECREIASPDRSCFSIPYRCLVVKNIDNMLMAGRMISATREAAGCIRPTVPCMVCGEAAGTAAAMLSKGSDTNAANMNIKMLRNRLKNNGVKC